MSSLPGPLLIIVIGYSISFSMNSIYLRQFSGIVKHNPGVIKNPDNVPYGTTIKIPKLAKKQ